MPLARACSTVAILVVLPPTFSLRTRLEYLVFPCRSHVQYLRVMRNILFPGTPRANEIVGRSCLSVDTLDLRVRGPAKERHSQHGICAACSLSSHLGHGCVVCQIETVTPIACQVPDFGVDLANVLFKARRESERGGLCSDTGVVLAKRYFRTCITGEGLPRSGLPMSR